LKGVS